MLPTCKQNSELMSQGQDRPLTLVESISLRLHLFLCQRCRVFSRQLEFMRVALRRYRDRN